MWSGKVALFERCLQVIMCGPSFVVKPPRLRLIALGLPLEVRVTFSSDRPCGLALTSTAYWLNRSVGTFPKFDPLGKALAVSLAVPCEIGSHGSSLIQLDTRVAVY